ncbi:hypothetical protein EJB05_15740, partial [Eragrostis curvula]
MDLQHLLLLLLVSLAFSPLLAQAVPEDHIDFDLATEIHDDLYDKLSTSLRATTPPYNPPDVDGRVVLAERRKEFYGQPPRWIMVHVRFGEAATTLAIAQDDLCLFGFNNSAGNWYHIEGYEGLPGSTSLPITQNYADLLGRMENPENAHKFLSRVPLGNQSAIEAVRTLAGYDPATTPVADLRKAMVNFVVVISEAMRFRAIRERISGQRWKQEAHITEEEASYVIYWAALSRLLITWNRSNCWGDPSHPDGWMEMQAQEVRHGIGVNGATDALRIVDFLIRPRPANTSGGGIKASFRLVYILVVAMLQVLFGWFD